MPDKDKKVYIPQDDRRPKPLSEDKGLLPVKVTPPTPPVQPPKQEKKD